MICPKCGFEQPDGGECIRCGLIISRYKGPVFGEAGAAGPPGTPPAFEPVAASPPPSFIPPPPVIAGGMVLAPAGGGFGDPPPVAAGGTVYGGPGAIAPVFSSFGAGFQGTFEVGKVLGESFSTYFSNFIPFLLLTAVVFLPVMALALYISSIKNNPGLVAFMFLGTLLLQMFLTPVATGGITYGVYQQMRGRSPSVVDCLRVGLSRLFPVLGVAIVAGFASGLAFLACLIPGLIVYTMFSVAVPVTIEERPGIVEALRRSSYLTETFRWQIFCVLFVLWIIQWILQQVVIQVLARILRDPGSLLMLLVLLGVATTGLSATASAVMYYRLRSVKESVDVDQISSVFA